MEFDKRFRLVLLGFLRLVLGMYMPAVVAAQSPLIFPVPQQLELTGKGFILDETVSVLLPPHASEKDRSLARILIRELNDRYGIALRTTVVSAVPRGQKVVIMGGVKNPLVQQYCTDHQMTLAPANPGKEGYVLAVTTNVLFVGGWDDAGAFYGLQSLRQLIQARKGNLIQGVHVRDWPEYPFRAIRMYVPGPENIAFLKRFMSDFMALYKYNKIIIELNCMRLDHHPEINTGWEKFVKYMQYTRSNSTEGVRGEEKNSSHYDAGDGFIIEKNEVRDLVKYANSNFLEVIPEIPSLTHAYYLLANHHELAEYPGDRWPDTYCPSNPKTYQLLFDVYDEYLDVIKPKMVQIGHDEWWGAPLGVCPLCRDKDYSSLYAGDIRKIHSYLSKRGIKTAMWGDFLLESVRGKGPQKRKSSTGMTYYNPGGLRPSIVRDSIPRDILIFNWFWIDQEKEKELNDFGFQQVFGNFTPNISHWDERTKKINLAGGAPSSWASTNEFNFGKDLLLDFLGCANLLWSPHSITQENLIPVVWELVPSIRKNLRAVKIPSEDGDSVQPIDISGLMNVTSGSDAFDIPWSNLHLGPLRAGRKIFQLGKAGIPKCAIAVDGRHSGEGFPERVSHIPIHEDVSSLIFLHACAFPAGNQKAYFNIPDNFDSADLLGWYEIVYEDGYIEVVPLQYGVNIMEWNLGGEKSLDKREGETGAPQQAYCYGADPVDCAAGTGKPLRFFSFEWVNKRLGKAIKEVNLCSSVNFKALQQDYGQVVTAPYEGNAIILASVSKVIRRTPFKPAAPSIETADKSK